MLDKYKLIDSHAHLDDERFDKDRDEVMQRAVDAGVDTIVNVSCWDSNNGFQPALDLAAKYKNIYISLGVHPHDAKGAGECVYNEIKRLARYERVVAIGETGLDYYYDNSPRGVQKDVFRRHIQLSRMSGMPIVVHTREAEKDTLEILKEEGAGETGGVLHCFSGSYEMAKACMDMGFFLSFTGVVTFPKASDIHEVVKRVPVDRILLETDSPYLAPVPHRGERNEPVYMIETASVIARLKGLSLEDVARITVSNTKNLFNIDIREDRPEIAYKIRDSLYLNITNMCTNYCTFCAKYRSFTVKGHYLRLRYEPTFSDVMNAIGPDPQDFREIVFCGFGEPLIRLELVKEVGLFLKKRGCRIRIDTDGLANLIHGRNVLQELKFVDEISVSLNAPDSETYRKIVKTPFGDRAFPAILWFLKEARKHISKVTASIVSVPGLDIEACRRLAEDDLGVAFRVREYNEVG